MPLSWLYPDAEDGVDTRAGMTVLAGSHARNAIVVKFTPPPRVFPPLKPASPSITPTSCRR